MVVQNHQQESINGLRNSGYCSIHNIRGGNIIGLFDVVKVIGRKVAMEFLDSYDNDDDDY